MEMKDITIIIPTRADLEYLKACLESISSKPQYKDCSILVGADTPTKEVEDFLTTSKYQFKIYKDPNSYRVGIVSMVEQLIQEVKTDYVFYMHDDMIIGEDTLSTLMASWLPKRILSSYRVEPPIYGPQAPEKYVMALGEYPVEFQFEKFKELEQALCQQHHSRAVEGFFAPHFFKKTDWVGYDPVFMPQSREDSDLAQRFMDAGCSLYTIWDSIVYHFSGKGSRKKVGKDDNEEWKKSNQKNQKNYIRKWGTLGHTPHILPVRVPKIPISATVLVGNEADRLPGFLENVEPYFEQFVFVIDKDQPDGVKVACAKAIADYSTKELANGPTNFKDSKFIVTERSLKQDFASQTNYATKLCSNDWVMKLDVDEVFPPEFLGGIRNIIKQTLEENPNCMVLGFTRVNLLDGKVSNDIPRQHWFGPEFDQYPMEPQGIQNQDYQFRLHKKEVEWVNKVHEVPECIAKNDTERVNIVNGVFFTHPKSRQRQFQQEQLYQQIQVPGEKKEITKFIYDSVIYTIEGITEHAREEIKELKSRGNKIFLLDTNYREGFGDFLKDCYTPIAFDDKEAVVVVNQPPSRWERSAHYPNRVGYLAFEGLLPKDWVEMINKSNVKELWTPSTYCKESFIKSGVTKPVAVIPHGINPAIWTPGKVQNPRIRKVKAKDEFLFLAVGTYHNNRKGLDLAVKAFNEAFRDQPKAKLVVKVNKIYSPGDRFSDFIKPYIDPTGNLNIEYIDEDLSTEDLADLFRMADCYVAPHRCEGFGINILNAMAVGTPVITTAATGNMDFCNKENSLLIDVDREVYSPWMHPYERSKWVRPSMRSLEKQMRKVFDQPETYKKKAMKNSKEIKDNWSWSNVVDKMQERIKALW